MRIGVDLGGTKIEAIALSAEGKEVVRQRTATPKDEHPERRYNAILDAILGLVRAVEREAGEIGTVGVGIPGAVSLATGLIKNANTTCLIGRPLDRDLGRALDRPVRLANDANCFALSEASDGAAAGAPVVFGVILGTGVGGGIVVDGKAIAGRNAIAGEWGHNPLPWAEPEERPGGRFCRRCYCGKEGCIETFLSGPNLAVDHRMVTGESLDAHAIARRAAEGDKVAGDTMARYTDRLARGLASVINVIDPDVIVLGGGLSNIEALYDATPRRWGRYGFTDRLDTALVPPRHGDSSGVRGAAWLWPQEKGR